MDVEGIVLAILFGGEDKEIAMAYVRRLRVMVLAGYVHRGKNRHGHLGDGNNRSRLCYQTSDISRTSALYFRMF